MGDKMKNSYIFIDFQNQSVDLKLIIDTLSKNRRIIGIKAYGHWYKHPILSLNYAKNGAELIEIPEDTFSSNKKNDIKLIVDAIETLFFVSKNTAKSGIHIRDNKDSKRLMIIVVIAMVPALLFGMWKPGKRLIKFK